MPTRLDPRFDQYLNRLKIEENSRRNYKQYVRWFEQYGLRPVTLTMLKYNYPTEQFIDEVASGYNGDPNKPRRKWSFNDRRKSDARTVLNHYRDFLLTDPTTAQKQLENAGEFNVSSDVEGKEKVTRSIALRRGQAGFRNNLLNAYRGRCAMTGTSVADALEAAHIIPYNGRSTNYVTNGLLLRCDIHTLFDLKLVSVDPRDFSIYCCDALRSNPTHRRLHGEKLRLPSDKAAWPDVDAVLIHFDGRLK